VTWDRYSPAAGLVADWRDPISPSAVRQVLARGRRCWPGGPVARPPPPETGRARDGVTHVTEHRRIDILKKRAWAAGLCLPLSVVTIVTTSRSRGTLLDTASQLGGHNGSPAARRAVPHLRLSRSRGSGRWGLQPSGVPTMWCLPDEWDHEEHSTSPTLGR
jgi:hypothetical protein